MDGIRCEDAHSRSVGEGEIHQLEASVYGPDRPDQFNKHQPLTNWVSIPVVKGSILLYGLYAELTAFFLAVAVTVARLLVFIFYHPPLQTPNAVI